MEAIKGEKSLEGIAGVLNADSAGGREAPVDVKRLHAKIGELTLEHDFLSRSARQGWPVAERKATIDRSHDLPVSRKTRALGISQSSVYHQPRPTFGH